MATIYVSPKNPAHEVTDDFKPELCHSTYSAYAKERTLIPFDNNKLKEFQEGKIRYRDTVCKPLAWTAGPQNNQKPKLKMAQYFTVKISELKALFDTTPEADYLHFHNTLDTEGCHMLFVIPVNSQMILKVEENPANNPAFVPDREIITPSSLAVETFPCPPDPRCQHNICWE